MDLLPPERQAIIQSFLGQNILTANEAYNVIRRVLSVRGSVEISSSELGGFLHSLSSEFLEPLDFKIVATKDQISGLTEFCLVNQSASKMQGATLLKGDEINFVKALLDVIFKSHDYSVDQREYRKCYNFTGKYTGTEIDALVYDLVDNGWLHVLQSSNGENVQHLRGSSRINSGDASGTASHTTSGYVSDVESANSPGIGGGFLGRTAPPVARTVQNTRDSSRGSTRNSIRSPGTRFKPSSRLLCELKPFLLANYGDSGSATLFNCVACNEIFTAGRACKSNSCKTRLHEPCSRAFFQLQGKRDCPACGQDLDDFEWIP